MGRRANIPDITVMQKAYMQLMRDRGTTVSDIADIMGIDTSTVYKNTVDERLPPIAGLGTVVEILVQLVVKATLRAYTDNSKDAALIVEKYTKALYNMIELKEAASSQDRILVYQELFDEFGNSGAIPLDVVRERYEGEKEKLLKA